MSQGLVITEHSIFTSLIPWRKTTGWHESRHTSEMICRDSRHRSDVPYLLQPQVVGNLQITSTALPSQATFDQLQEVDGNVLIANNNAMAAFDAYSLRFAGSGISVFQNPLLESFEAPQLTAIASGTANDVITTGLQVCAVPSLLTLLAAQICQDHPCAVAVPCLLCLRSVVSSAGKQRKP